MRRYVRALVFLVAATATVATAAPPPQAVGWPDARHDAAIPAHEAVLGYRAGEEISSPEQIERYLAALAAAAPERTRLVEYARSWEGRALSYLVVGSPANVARLDDIKAAMQALADPRGRAAAEIEVLRTGLPVIVWLAHGVHGNEISSPEAALVTAFHLLSTAKGTALLEDAVVVIDPLENPDGRARFVQHFRSLYGLEPQGARIAAERRESWPSGRTNHYLFDMNRDWFAQTQPEVQGRVRAFLEFYPLVYVDLHEMNSDSTYYFPPPAVPYNPFLAEKQLEAYAAFGEHTATRFDQFGYRYFTREVYDAYYPGYGDTWPTLHGSLGMTFEMASARGLLANREDGTRLRYADGVQRHFVASIATIETAVRDRDKLLREFTAFRGEPVSDQVYLLPRQGDVGRVDKLANTLSRQGIEVRQLSAGARLCGERQPAGSYLIGSAQPAGRLASTLLEDDSPLDEAFWEEQERRAEKRLDGQIYDIIGWSLPLLWGVEVIACRTGIDGYPLAAEVAEPEFAQPGSAQVAYLVPWGSQAAVRFLSGALRGGATLESSNRPFTLGEREYGAGTLIVRVSANPDGVHELVKSLADTTGAEVVAVDTSWVSAGVNFGSSEMRPVPRPRVAVAWGERVAVSSAGSLRFVIEQKFGYPAAPVRLRHLDSVFLDEFDVLLLPDAEDLGSALGEKAVANVKRWLEAGGTLVAVGASVKLLAGPLGVFETRPERLAVAADASSESAEAEGRSQGDAEDEKSSTHNPGTLLPDADALAAAVAPAEDNPPPILGAVLNATTDNEHWLAAGTPDVLRFIVEGDTVFSPLRRDKGVNVVSFADADSLVAAGHLWEASRQQWARKPAVMAVNSGRGIAIGFVADPSFRGYMDGLDVLLANAVFRGPAQASPVRVPGSQR